MERLYYEAYDDRYRQVHQENLAWFAETPSRIVSEVIERFGVRKNDDILELGCGEGRDAIFLLRQKYSLEATDVSKIVIAYCRKRWPEYADRFAVLDCVHGSLNKKYDFIYAVAVLHMFVKEEDRNGFYQFIRDHLKAGGTALICTMGDGELERSSDITKAFELQKRVHESSGKTLKIASTSYRAVSFDTFKKELTDNGLRISDYGLTEIEPDYWKMMYAAVQKS